MKRSERVRRLLLLIAASAASAVLPLSGCSGNGPAGEAPPEAVQGRRFDEAPAARIGRAAPSANSTSAASQTASSAPGSFAPTTGANRAAESDTENQPPAGADASVPISLAPTPPIPTEMIGDALKVSFDFLASYEYWPYPLEEADPNLHASKEIPASVKSIHGKRVAVSGFMMPVAVRNGQVDAFLLVRNQLMCCFGMPVGPNEWIDVKMKDGVRARYVPDVPVTVFGLIDIGENATKDGLVLSLYRMVADEVKLPDF